MTIKEMMDKLNTAMVELSYHYIYDDTLSEILDMLEDVYRELRDGETDNGNQ